jgi:hypothetical protein
MYYSSMFNSFRGFYYRIFKIHVYNILWLYSPPPMPYIFSSPWQQVLAKQSSTQSCLIIIYCTITHLNSVFERKLLMCLSMTCLAKHELQYHSFSCKCHNSFFFLEVIVSLTSTGFASNSRLSCFHFPSRWEYRHCHHFIFLMWIWPAKNITMAHLGKNPSKITK